MDAIVLRRDWGAGEGDFVELWEDSGWSECAMAARMIEAETGTNDQEAIDRMARDYGFQDEAGLKESVGNWLRCQLGWLPQSGHITDRQPEWLDYWTAERCGIQSGKPDNWRELDASAAHRPEPVTA